MKPRSRSDPRRVDAAAGDPLAGIGARPSSAHSRAYRLLNGGAGALSFSVLADSALEHYRGGFYNPAMFVAPAVSALTLGTSLAAALRGSDRGRRHAQRKAIFAAAAATGIAGLGFHLYNIGKREGGWSWLNVFYGAPVAAPLGIHLAGLFGLAASRVIRGARSVRRRTGGRQRSPPRRSWARPPRPGCSTSAARSRTRSCTSRSPYRRSRPSR